jgi:hypothetical protein
LQRRL